MVTKYHVHPGDVFFDVTAMKQINGSVWIWLCICGTFFTDKADRICSTHRKSCGCRRDRVRTTHGMTNTKVYRAWHDAKMRCNNPSHSQYLDYGGRGIIFCERWNTFENFFSDMGQAPAPEYSLDREDNNGGYDAENCRWVTKKAQSNNTRQNRVFEINGIKKTLTQWSEHYGISRDVVYERVDNGGWYIKAALETLPGKTEQDGLREKNDILIKKLLKNGRIYCDKLGNIFSGATGKGSNGKNHMYRQRIDENGRKTVGVSLDGQSHNFKVSRIIAFKFLKNNDPSHKTQVHHKDGNPLNNCWENLEWITPSKNCKEFQKDKKGCK